MLSCRTKGIKKIPKIFIIDSIPQHNKELNDEFININVNGMVNSFCGLPINYQLLIYNNYADGFMNIVRVNGAKLHVEALQ